MVHVFITILNPEHVVLFVILIGIPVYEFLVKKYLTRYIPNMLTRMSIGFFICLIREMLLPFFSLLADTTENISSCYMNYLYQFTGMNSSIVTLCIIGQTKLVINGTCELACLENEDNDNLFLLLLIPQILHGLIQLLVFMTVLEFICAQAPQTMNVACNSLY